MSLRLPPPTLGCALCRRWLLLGQALRGAAAACPWVLRGARWEVSFQASARLKLRWALHTPASLLLGHPQLLAATKLRVSWRCSFE